VEINGQKFTSEVLERIQGIIAQQPEISRSKLSREVCKFLDWRSANGALKEMSCRVALLKLEKMGYINLPPAGQRPPSRRKKAGVVEGIDELPSISAGVDLAELGTIEIIAIKSWDRKRSRIWNYLLDHYHYLGSGPLCGAQIRYLIKSSRYGWLGGLAFSAAAWRLEARDKWIGWNEDIRRQNLEKVVYNSRFLILPQVKVPNLASHVLSLSVKRLCVDWQERYGIKPLLVETFVERGRFRGTCYRAANWIYVGSTKGRGRQDVKNKHAVSVKDIYLYPLQSDAREELCEGIVVPIQAKRDCEDWAEEELGAAQLGDGRRKKRLLIIARDFFARPQESIPTACEGDSAKTKAAYRFFDHKEHTMEKILFSHHEATIGRMRKEKVVLAVQDTTVLNYKHPDTKGLGPIGSSKEGSIGLFVHDTMCFTAEGTPLGLVDVQCWARDRKDFGKKHRRHDLAIEEKESYKWLRSFHATKQAQKQCPDTVVVSVGDREADIYELFRLAVDNSGGPKLLVRAEQKRLLTDGQGHLWDHLRRQPLATKLEIHIPRRGKRSAHNVKLEVRYAEVTLKPPVKKPKLGEVKIWAVLAEEGDCPEGVKPTSWMLLTTCEVSDVDAAIERLKWYSTRWSIEVYHRTLKSGCNIEQRQLGHANRIEACLAIDMVVAWRIYHLTKLGREVPNLPCTVFFEEDEWKALVAYKTRDPIIQQEAPSLREMMRMVASLGGFLGRKCDGEPGTKSLWIGLQRLDDITNMWRIAMQMYAQEIVDPPPGAQ